MLRSTCKWQISVPAVTVTTVAAAKTTIATIAPPNLDGQTQFVHVDLLLGALSLA